MRICLINVTSRLLHWLKKIMEVVASLPLSCQAKDNLSWEIKSLHALTKKAIYPR